MARAIFATAPEQGGVPGWTVEDIPDLTGGIATVTGTGGLGFETALALASSGAHVVIAGRDPDKGAAATARIRTVHPQAAVSFEPLDLASLASVEAFVARFQAGHTRLDILVNNAGVMALPERRTTADGIELQLATNYLGHFALTGGLLPALRKAKQPRVVQLASLAHLAGRIRLDDLQSERGYNPWSAYGQSKLAMLMFAFELQRRSDASGWGLLSTAAHPGFANTDLIANGAGGKGLSMMGRLSGVVAPHLGQSAAAGALPTLFAAASPDAKPCGYYGPDGPFEMKGSPTVARVGRQAQDRNVAKRLWERSQALTNSAFPE